MSFIVVTIREIEMLVEGGRRLKEQCSVLEGGVRGEKEANSQLLNQISELRESNQSLSSSLSNLQQEKEAAQIREREQNRVIFMWLLIA